MLATVPAVALQKNIASQNICAQMISKTDGSIITTGTTTIYITGDGTQSGGTTTATHKGQGLWCYQPAQGETNYSHVAYTFINPSAVYTSVQTYPGENASSDQAVQILSRVTSIGGSQRVVASLNDMIQAQSGDNWLEVEVWVTDADGNKFDPADITPYSGGTRSYNGVGAEFEDQSGNKVVMYDDSYNPLGSCTFCHHTNQTNKPQIIPRISIGYYRFWTNATAYNNLLPIGQLRTNVGYFDISQPTATYGSTHISDTTPTTSHKEVSFKALVQEAVGYQNVINQVIASEGDISNILGTPAHTTLAGDIAALGAAGDPWNTPLPGAYGAGTAGKIIGAIPSGVTVMPSTLSAGVLQQQVTVTNGSPVLVVRGDAKTLTFNLGTGWPLTGKKVYFIAKKDRLAANSTAIVNRTATVTDAVNGVASITLTSTETGTVGSYYAEIRVYNTDDSNPQTARQFTLQITQDVRQ